MSGDPGHRAFNRDEYAARIERVRLRMQEARIDLLLVSSPENICYLTGYQTAGYFAWQALILPLATPPVLLIRHLERGNVAAHSWLADFETWREGEDVLTRTLDLLRQAGARGRVVGLEKRGWFLTAAAAEALAAGLDSSRIVDASLLIDRVRLIKSPAEIGYLHRAARIAERTQRSAWKAIESGGRESEIAAAVYRTGIEQGGEYTGLPQHIMSGPHYDLAHATWSARRIRRGELVLLELYGCVARYHATQMRTVVLGPPSRGTLHAAEQVIAAQDRAIAAMRPGASARDIDALVRVPLRKLRHDYYNRTGYSTGIGFPPRTGEWDAADFNEQEDWELRPNMVFHMLALAGGFGISETMLITEQGAERLTVENPRELIIREDVGDEGRHRSNLL